MSLTLSGAVAQCPRSLFGDKDKGTPPKFRKVFALVAKAILNDAGEKFDEKTVDLVANYVNPSSLQRAVADHRATITGKIDMETGKYLPVEEKLPRKERGKTRPKAAAKVDVGLSKKKAKKGKNPKAAAKKTVGEKSGMVRTKAEGPGPAETAKKAPSKAASAPEVKKMAGAKLDAIAAARASLAAKKAAKAAEETVEI